MIILALDTCDSRGSVAVLRDDQLLHSVAHEGTTEYSLWLLPAVAEALKAANISMHDVDLFAVAAGPGSFTGVRMGLTTVKAWSEVYGKGIASVSRLEAMASEALPGSDYVAAFFDAHRDQLYAGLYEVKGVALHLINEEIVAAPTDFLRKVAEHAGDHHVRWISLDPDKMLSHEAWKPRAAAGERVETSPSVLSPAVGRIGRQRALESRLTDVLQLDAEYVRRPDAEVNWKGVAKRVT